MERLSAVQDPLCQISEVAMRTVSLNTQLHVEESKHSRLMHLVSKEEKHL